MLFRSGIHLLISPTPHGELIIGDSHDYGSDASPFNAEQVDDWMIELAEQTLSCKIQVVERWQGVYGSRGPGPFSFLRAAPGVSAALMDRKSTRLNSSHGYISYAVFCLKKKKKEEKKRRRRRTPTTTT